MLLQSKSMSGRFVSPQIQIVCFGYLMVILRMASPSAYEYSTSLLVGRYIDATIKNCCGCILFESQFVCTSSCWLMSMFLTATRLHHNHLFCPSCSTRRWVVYVVAQPSFAKRYYIRTFAINDIQY